jgi:hypothetical protein
MPAPIAADIGSLLSWRRRCGRRHEDRAVREQWAGGMDALKLANLALRFGWSCARRSRSMTGLDDRA